MAIHTPAQSRPAGQARGKSYMGKVWLTLVLYCIYWLPGFIANIVFYRQGRRDEEEAGARLPGVRVLAAMFWAGLVFLVLFVVLTAFLAVASNVA
ncbi:MAG TPA: hypothetical protein VFA70_01995 [Dehalococcoidia bacterium]|jgi:hypothetical protein|nr:hypothetical protein [Dehalococcoidia bacterium]